MGAGLFVKTLANLKNIRTGFESAGNLVSFQVDPAKNGYPVARTRAFYTDALREIRAIPGVKSAAYAMWALLNGSEWDLTVAVEGHQAEQGEDMQAYYNLVSPGYWKAMGIPLLQGRDFDERDRVDGGDDPQPWNVAIVNREFAEHFFGAQDPIGRRIGCCHGPGTKPLIRIVGVVENSLFGVLARVCGGRCFCLTWNQPLPRLSLSTFEPRSPRRRSSRRCDAWWRSLTGQCQCTT